MGDAPASLQSWVFLRRQRRQEPPNFGVAAKLAGSSTVVWPCCAVASFPVSSALLLPPRASSHQLWRMMGTNYHSTNFSDGCWACCMLWKMSPQSQEALQPGGRSGYTGALKLGSGQEVCLAFCCSQNSSDYGVLPKNFCGRNTAA